MNELSKAIDQAVENCKEWGSGSVEFDNMRVNADWCEDEDNEEIDNIVVFIYQNDIIKLEYVIEN